MLLTFNSTLPEVCNLSQQQIVCIVAKDKETSVYFDYDKYEFVGLTKAVISKLEDTYKLVNVQAELNKMNVWLSSSKLKRKGNIGFIMNWLQRAAPITVNESYDLIEKESPLRPLLEDYLKDLWKGREHILEFNKIKR